MKEIEINLQFKKITKINYNYFEQLHANYFYLEIYFASSRK